MSDNTTDLDLLDLDLDEIDDLPGFSVPFNGQYLLKMSMAMKTINNKAALETSFEVIECLEKNNPGDPDTPAGERFSKLYFLQGEPEAVATSKGKLKQLLAAVAEKLGEGNIKLLVRDHFSGPQTVKATVKRQADRTDKEKFYANVTDLQLA